MREFLSHPLTKRLYWVLFAIVFYNSGQSFTIWLLQPESFNGGSEWFWLAMFPLLLPAFFLLNRHLGCASGQCSSKRKPDDKDQRFNPPQMPG